MDWSAIALCAAALGAGCAHRASPLPAAALEGFADLLSRDDPHLAWLQLAESVRVRVPDTTFASEWRATAPERKSEADAIRRALLRSRLHETALVEVAGQSSPLVRQLVGWKLTTPRRSELGAPTPEEAVRRFVQALEEHNLDAFLRLLADPLRTVVERELAERLTHLKATIGKPIPIEGERARLRYDARFHLDLVKENGQWRVGDFN